MVEFVEPIVRIDDHRLYVRDYPGSEPAIILMHGFPDNLHLYDRLIPEFASRRVVALRLPGLGEVGQARRLPVHGQQPDRRPRRGHRAPAACLGGAGGPRRLRPTRDRLGAEPPGTCIGAGLVEHVLLPHAWACALRRRSGCSRPRSSAGSPHRFRCGSAGWSFAVCTSGRWGGSSGTRRSEPGSCPSSTNSSP